MKQIFKIGTIFWTPKAIKKYILKGSRIEVEVPTRVCTYPVHFEKFIDGMTRHEYEVKHIIFTIDLTTKMSIVYSLKHSQIIVKNKHKNDPIVMHAVLIMKKTLGLKGGFEISYTQTFPSKAGMASSASLQSATLLGINTLFGEPISKQDLVKFAVKNYGESTEIPENLVHVPVLGSVMSAAMNGGGIIALGKRSKVEARLELSHPLRVFIGIPTYKEYGGSEDLDEILKNTEIREKLGRYSEQKNNAFETQIIPSLKNRNISIVFDEIWKYTSGVYGDIGDYYHSKHPDVQMKDKIHTLVESKNPKISSAFVSSAGPSFVVISKSKKCAERIFHNLGISTMIGTKVRNLGFSYRII